jgi:hypothetical protein
MQHATFDTRPHIENPLFNIFFIGREEFVNIVEEYDK